MSLFILLVGILALMLFIGLFLWSVMEERPKPLWLILAVASVAGGVVGFLLTK